MKNNQSLPVIGDIVKFYDDNLYIIQGHVTYIKSSTCRVQSDIGNQEFTFTLRNNGEWIQKHYSKTSQYNLLFVK